MEMEFQNGYFDTFRKYGGPTLYGPMKTAVTADILEAGFLYAIATIAFSLLILLPGFRGNERLFFLARVLLGVFILGCIMLCNFGQEWEVAHIHTKTQYRAGLKEEIEADIGVRIGLRSVNITLKTDPEVHEFEKENETINYNERFSWNNLGWTQGRFGFGPFASTVNQEFRAAQFNGAPYPILWIAEYFTLDGEGIRWGRYYRQAGYYTHILIWLAFPLWILSMILFKMVLHYGAYFSILTGCCLLLGNILYATIRNPLELLIPFEDAKLEFTWGWTFWLNLINGLLCLIIGVVVWFMELRFKESIFTFFGLDISADIEAYYASVEEQRQMGIRITNPETPKRPSMDGDTFRPNGTADDDDTMYDNAEKYRRMFRRKQENRGTIGRRFLKGKTVGLRNSQANELDDQQGNGIRFSGETENIPMI